MTVPAQFTAAALFIDDAASIDAFDPAPTPIVEITVSDAGSITETVPSSGDPTRS